MSNELIINGEIVLDGAVISDATPQWYYDGGVFSPSMVRAALAEIEGPAVVWVNSSGGDPTAGEAIRVMLAGHEGGVTVKVAGDASSAASLLIMGAHRIEVSAGSVLMIHDPSTFTFGDEADHQQSINMLGALAATYASVYAARSGKSLEDVRAMMVAETWLTPEGAIEGGFADALIGEVPEAPLQMNAAKGDTPAIDAARGRYQSAQAMLSRAHYQDKPAPNTGPQSTAMRGLQMAQRVATEGQMPNTNINGDTVVAEPNQTPNDVGSVVVPVEMNADQIRVNERARSRDITMAARPHMASGLITQDFVDGLIDDGVTVEMASHRMLEQLGGAQEEIVSPRRGGAPAMIGRDEVDTRRTGLEMAFAARLSESDPADTRAHPFMEMSVHEMAAASMGRSNPGYGSFASRSDLIMQAMHTTSDFSNILSGAFNRVLSAQYEIADRTFTAISREMTFNDFRPHEIIGAGNFPLPKKVNEAGEIKFGTLGDSSEIVALAAYASGLSISRQALVNDDLGAIQGVIDGAAMVVPEFEEDVFWAYYLGNPVLSDGIAMYHSDHNNLGSSAAINVAKVSEGRKAMRSQKALGEKGVVKMNAPSILLVGPARETEAEQFLAATVATKDADTNIFKGKLSLVVTETITNNEWHLLVAPAKRSHNMTHGYLRDSRVPRVRVENPFGTQGMQMTLEADFGVGGANFRGGYKRPH